MADPRKEAWLAERRTMITGTDAAQIVAMDADPELAEELGRFGGAMGVYLEKIGEALPVEETGAMLAGQYLQRPILDMYSDRQQVAITYEPEWTIRRSPTMAHIGASLDAMRFDAPAPVDAKNIRVQQAAKWGEEGTDQVPAYYAVQLVMQMHVTGADFADLAVLFSGQDFRVYRVWRDAALEADILAKCYDFWRYHVVPRVPPPVDGSAAWSEHLKRAFRQQSQQVIAATDPALTTAAIDYKDADRDEKLAKARKEAAGNRLRAAIGEARGVEGPQFRALWSQIAEQKGTDWEAVARELAGADDALAKAAAKHEVVLKQSYRRLTVTTKE